MRISSSHTKLLELLQQAERSGKELELHEILAATGWKEDTFRTYKSKGQLADFLHQVGNTEKYNATKTQGLTPEVFSKLLSQSKHRRGLGYLCKDALAKSLLQKSRDNMILALELYNRPSLENRLDSFVILFSVAWELILKAHLIERDGVQSIFRKRGAGVRIRETISLRECIERTFTNQQNKVRLNLERITELRDKAVHLLIPEMQGALSRLFQSGVLNYSKFFYDFTKIPFIDGFTAGMISLVGDFKEPSVVTMKSNYGSSVGIEMYDMVSSIISDIKSVDDIDFAIPINVELAYTAKNEDGNIIKLAGASDGIEGLKAAIISKPIDASKVYKYTEKPAIERINARLHELYDEDTLKDFLVVRDKQSGQLIINQNCFRAIVRKLKWKSSDNTYHREDPVSKYHAYSDLAVEEFVKKVISQKGYLERAKKSYSSSRKPRKDKS